MKIQKSRGGVVTIETPWSQRSTDRATQRVRSAIAPQDQAELILYWTEWLGMFERSNMGSQLEVAFLFSFARCEKCLGKGEAESADETLKRFKATGKLKRTPHRCRSCRGRGYVRPKRRNEAIDDHTRLPAEPLTAQPTRPVQHILRDEGGLDVLASYGRISRVLNLMHPDDIATLEAFFGCVGEWSEERSQKGRIFAVCCRTPAGRAIIRHGRDEKVRKAEDDGGEPLVLVDYQELANQLDRKKDAPPAKLVTAMHEQAVKLLERADASWAQAVVHRPRKRRGTGRPAMSPILRTFDERADELYRLLGAAG